MARCCYCNEKIKTGEDFILEGPYPEWGRGRAYWFGEALNHYGTIYHKTCFLKMLAKESQTETVASHLSENFLKRYSEKMQE